MRRIVDKSDTPPPKLLVFRGRAYRTESEWVSAYDRWLRARERWLSLRGLPEDALPWQIDGDCPFDPSTI